MSNRYGQVWGTLRGQGGEDLTKTAHEWNAQADHVNEIHGYEKSNSVSAMVLYLKNGPDAV